MAIRASFGLALLCKIVLAAFEAVKVPVGVPLPQMAAGLEDDVLELPSTFDAVKALVVASVTALLTGAASVEAFDEIR